MSATISPTRRRLPSVVSVIGVVLLAGGVAAAIIIRLVTMANLASGPMQVLPVKAYASYAIGPASPLTNPYALSDTMVFFAFGVAAVGLLALVLGVALRATRRHPR
jgi:hypothetical protein